MNRWRLNLALFQYCNISLQMGAMQQHNINTMEERQGIEQMFAVCKHN